MFRRLSYQAYHAKQCDGKAGGQRHVGRRGVGKSNHGGATRGDQGAIEFTARPETAKKKVDGRDEHRCVERARQAGSPIADAGGTERHHRLPVIKDRLFEPRFALQRRGDPIGAIEHFARDLRVAGFVGADQSEGAESIEKKKSAERRQQQQVGAGLRICFLPIHGISGRARFC